MSAVQKTTLITGAGSGIGAEICAQLLAQQHTVWAVDKNTSALASLQQQYPNQLYCQDLDIRDAPAVQRFLADLLAQQTIDTLICAAGVLQMGYGHTLTLAQWQDVFAVNTQGVFLFCQPVAAQMRSRQQGAIVIISSNAATTPRINMGAYAASKAATTQFAKCLGLELAPLGIRVNIVSPGSTDTPMQQAMWQQGSSQQTVIAGNAKDFRLGIPLQKIATPKDIAQGVLFLLSDAAAHITLHDLRIDGGATLDS